MPSGYGPLPSAHFDNIHQASLICVVIQGRNYVAYGLIYRESNSNWDSRIFDETSFGLYWPDRANLTVDDPDEGPHARIVRQHSFPAELRCRLMFDQPGYEDRQSLIVKKGGDHVFYAKLSPNLPTLDHLPSLISPVDIRNNWPLHSGKARPHWL